MIRGLLILLVTIMLAMPTEVQAPEIQKSDAVRMPITTKSLSRGMGSGFEKRVMECTAYTRNDEGMDGKGITASGVKAVEGVTVAADSSLPFGTQIYIPTLGQAFTVTDRGGAITDGKLDVYMESREDALEFGVRELEVYILHP